MLIGNSSNEFRCLRKFQKYFKLERNTYQKWNDIQVQQLVLKIFLIKVIYKNTTLESHLIEVYE